MTLHIRPARAEDADLLARWAQAMALETENKILPDADVRPGIARGIADKLVQQIKQPCQVGAATVQVGASVGIALCPDQADDIDQLLLLADQDMYRAKALRQGRQATTTRDWLVHP